MTKAKGNAHAQWAFVKTECKQWSINFVIGHLVVRFADVCTFYVPFLYAAWYNYIKLQVLCIVDMNGCTVWYRLDVAVHNYSYLIIKINNSNELPTFLLNTGRYMYICHSVARRAFRVVRRRMSHFCRTRKSTGFHPSQLGRSDVNYNPTNNAPSDLRPTIRSQAYRPRLFTVVW